MTVLQEIFTWAEANLSPWQKDAVSRLYANRELTQKDTDELYALALAEHGVPAPQGLTATPLEASQFAAPPIPERLVQLVAIRDLQNVNAIASGVTLPIAPIGLTVIYGKNGAGKSGYSRVLKRACRARDQREPIHPDARKKPGTSGPASAVFDVLLDGVPQSLQWSSHQKESPEQLSEVAIFDSRCARAYIDNSGDFAYVPYGLDILEGLAKVSAAIRDRLVKEKQLHTPIPDAYNALALEKTAVGKALTDVPTTTTPDTIEGLAALSEAERERLTVLRRVLAEPDAKQKAAAIRQRVRWLQEAKRRVEVAVGMVSANRIERLRTLVEGSRTAKKAAEIAAKSFLERPSLLPGTGSDPWRTLLEAARSFAAISHPDHAFPNLPAQSACPLCQNPLGDGGASRLVQFDQFLQQTVEKEASEARTRAVADYTEFKGKVPSIQFEDALNQELAATDATLPATLTDLIERLKGRHEQVLKACGGDREWDQVPAIPDLPAARLQQLSAALEEEAKALDATTDEGAKAALLSEHLELDARKRLGDVKAVVTDAIKKYRYCSKLQSCLNTLGPSEITKISRKATSLAATTAKQEVVDALNGELAKLNANKLHVVMQPTTSGGKTQFKLVLELPGAQPPTDILSEGEQRALSIAAFLAEVRLGKGRGGIVFDDPVSSLDHRRRWEVAARLVQEAKSRQVVVFTHDIYFLFRLEQAAKKQNVDFSAQHVRQTQRGFGDHSPELPFEVLSTGDRLRRLRQALVAIRKSHDSGDEENAARLTQELYTRLRDTWERAVEEILFNQVVMRFSAGVSTQRLKTVTVEDADYAEVDAGMSRCSDFAHDPSREVCLPTPSPDDVGKDIEALDAWCKSVNARGEKTRRARG